MNQVLNANDFVELDEKEAMDVDGGGVFGTVAAAAATGAVKAATTVGAACGLGPVGGGVVIACCVVGAIAGAVYARSGS